MNVIIIILDFLQKYSTALTILIAVIAGLWGYRKFSFYVMDQRFNTYHRIIKELVDAEGPKRDRQTAIIYEFRNFPSYYEFSIRLLGDLRKSWFKEDDLDNPIIREIDLTLEYLNKWYRKKIF